MRILVLNCGSSSLKFELIDVHAAQQLRLAEGKIADIGARATVRAAVGGGGVDGGGGGGASEVRPSVDIPDHGAATRWALEWLGGIAPSPGRPDAVGHRVVHGGPHLFAPALIDANVVREITAVGDVAPLHNHGALQAIDAARRKLGDDVPMVAVFDTAFHHDLPERAGRYAIPPEMADEHGVRRYGFHGLAHRYMAERCAELLRRPRDDADLRLITMQLGSGCSMAAIRSGRSVDTSMGFSPLEGLVMGTRSGDIDPAVMRYLCDRRGMTADEADDWLNRECGLRGVSGVSADVRDLLRLEAQGDARAALALELFCYRLKKYIGAYLAALGGADAVVFGGGIGENSADIRARACGGMAWLGLHLDEARNRDSVAVEADISGAQSRIRAFVIPVDEEIIIARDTFDCLRRA